MDQNYLEKWLFICFGICRKCPTPGRFGPGNKLHVYWSVNENFIIRARSALKLPPILVLQVMKNGVP